MLGHRYLWDESDYQFDLTSGSFFINRPVFPKLGLKIHREAAIMDFFFEILFFFVFFVFIGTILVQKI